MDRLDMVQGLMELVLETRGASLCTAPIKDPKRMLDIGTGTGLWAMDAGDAYPQAEIKAIDLSPIQPRWVPPNVHFELDDVEKEWTYSKRFDYIHCRAMYGSITDWPNLIKNCYKNTSSEGYCEFIDWDNQLTSPDSSIPDNSAFKLFNKAVVDQLEKSGRLASPGPLLEGWMRAAGFEIVSKARVPLPFGEWPRDPKLKKIGAWNYQQLVEGLEGFAYGTLCKLGDWSKDEVDVLCAQVREELKKNSFHSMLWLHIVVGKRRDVA